MLEWMLWLPGLRGGRPCRSGISGEPGGAGRSSDPPGGQKIFQEVKIFYKLKIFLTSVRM